MPYGRQDTGKLAESTSTAITETSEIAVGYDMANEKYFALNISATNVSFINVFSFLSSFKNEQFASPTMRFVVVFESVCVYVHMYTYICICMRSLSLP